MMYGRRPPDRTVASGRGAHSRQRIVAAAQDLFIENGFQLTTMEDIAQRAGVARTTVFNHFPRKELLVAALTHHNFIDDQFFADLVSPLSTVQRIGDALRQWAHLYQDEPVAGRALVRAWVQAGGYHLPNAAISHVAISDTLAAGIRHGDIVADVNAHTAALVIVDLAFGALVRWARPQIPAESSATDLVTEVMHAAQLVLDRLGAPGPAV